MSIGIWQVILVLAIILILFGAGKLPRVMGDLAKGIKNFREGMQEQPPANQIAQDQSSQTLNTEKSSVKEETLSR